MGETARLGSVRDGKLTFCCYYVRIDGAAYVGKWVVDYKIRIPGLVGRGSIHLKFKKEGKGKG